MYEVFKEFSFDSAHYLPHVPDGHKCRRLHGHTYRVRVWVAGELVPQLGWVADYATIAVAWKAVNEALDHRLLNDVAGLHNPTSENIARWIWGALETRLPGLCRVELRETCTAGCVYTGPGNGCEAD